MPLTVTFDTNTLASVVSPETAQRGTGPYGAIVRAAIRSGHVQGFFSETLVILEGIRGKDRVDILGRTRLVSKASSASKNQISLTVGVSHVRDALDARFSGRVQAGSALGMRALRTAARIGSHHLHDENCPVFEPEGGILALLRCMDRVNEMTTKIAERDVGQAVAVKLGVKFSERDGVVNPELFLQGLGRARDDGERNAVTKAVAEWADGDSVAAHYGFGMQWFCSDDFGIKAPVPSVLDCINRKWLNEEFGIHFVRLCDLAKMVTA
jgi:hypothetical protein